MGKLLHHLTFNPIEALIFAATIAVSIGLLATPYYQYAILPGLLLFILFFLGRYPQVGFYIIVSLIPFSAYTGIISRGGFSIPRFVGIWVTVVILFSFLFDRKNPFKIQSNLWFLLLAFFLVNVVSGLMSDYSSTSFNNLSRLFIAYTFFAITLIFVPRKAFCHTLPKVLIISVSISSFLAIIGYIFDISFFTTGGLLRRAEGATHDPNYFSMIIIFCLPLLLHKIFFSHGFFWKTLTITLFIMNLIAILFTYSRAGGFSLVFVLGMLFIDNIRRFKPRYLGFLGIVAIISIAMIIIFVPASYYERLRSVTNTATDSSLGQRESHLFYGWEKIKENPVIGGGPGTYADFYAVSSYAHKFVAPKAESYRDYRRPAHNAYIEILVGTGILGFIVFLLIVWRALRNFYHAQKLLKDNGEEELSSLIRAYTISFISVLSFFFLLSMDTHKFFWGSIALSYVAMRISREKTVEDGRKPENLLENNVT
jgi:O-antigen ligase